MQAKEKIAEKENIIKLKDLTYREKTHIKEARSLIQKYVFPNIWNIRYVEDLEDEYNNTVLGLCSYQEEIIYLNTKILTDLEETLEVMLHEAIHQYTKADDCSEEFQNAATQAAVKFAMGCTRAKRK